MTPLGDGQLIRQSAEYARVQAWSCAADVRVLDICLACEHHAQIISSIVVLLMTHAHDDTFMPSPRLRRCAERAGDAGRVRACEPCKVAC